jgi:hypothetical protein
MSTDRLAFRVAHGPSGCPSSNTHRSFAAVDASGRAVRALLEAADRGQGHHQEPLDPSGLPAGQYTLRLSNGVWITSVKVFRR